MKTIFVWAIFSILLLFSMVAGAGAAMQCFDCHGTSASSDYRPTDAAYRNISTGAFKGNHRTHMGANAVAGTCVACHGAAAATYANSHRNGQITMAANINNSPKAGGATYSRGSSFAQGTNPAPGTCANVNCHFETATPAWDAAPFSSPADCNRCHGSAPNTGSHPVTGAKHSVYYGTTTASCVKCHPDHAAEGSPFAHATSAGKRDLAVSFTAAPNSGSGAYSGALNDYLPSQANAFGTCTATYCHSPGNKASGFDAPNAAATWGGSLDCKGCHKADIASGSTMASGTHGSHLNNLGVGYTTIKCVTCHAATVTGGMTIANTGVHVDKQIAVAFDNTSSATNGRYNGTLATPGSPMTKAPGSSYATCSNVYCHSKGQGAGGGSLAPADYAAPVWGNAATGKCGTCHGMDGKSNHASFPGWVVQRRISSGSHLKHISYGLGASTSDVKCVVCHAYDNTGFSPAGCSNGACHGGALQTGAKHANYEINVAMPTYFGASAAYSGSTLPGDGYGSCNNVYCHSDGQATPATYVTATWGNAASGACGTCHGVTAAAPPASVPHGKHMGSATPYRFSCAECHSGKVQVTANTTTAPAFTNLTSHVNKARNVTFDSTNTFGTYSTATLSCRNLYCHSTGNTSVAAGNLPGVYGGKVYSRITWSGSTTCASCHGRSTANGMPDYANAGAPGSATANSHGKHVTSSNIQCAECHEKTTKSNTSIRSTAPSYHVNGTNHDVFFNLSSNSAAGTYDDAQKKCSATYCHGAGASLAWGGTTYCNSCHSASAASSGGGGINNWGSGTPASAHKLHWEDASALPSKFTNYSTGNLGSAGTYRFACASCHNPASTTHVNGYASGSYRAQVFFGYTSPGKKPIYTYTGAAGTADNGFAWSNGNTTCTATYCHSNGAGGAGNTAVSWAATANSATNTRCKACHSYTTASGALIATNKHAKHADGTTYSFNCATCHNLTTTDGATIADKTKHVNKAKNVAWDSLNSDGSAYVNSVTACANIYCHSQGTTFAQPYTGAGKAPNTAVTWGGGQTLACNGCHGNANGYTTGAYRAATPLYASGSPKGNAHQLHVDARLGTDAGAQCLHCHNATTTTNTSITTYANHVNEAYTVAPGGTYRDGNNTTTTVAVTVSYAYNAAGSSCSNVSCHPIGLGKANKTDTVVAWKTGYQCSDCHNIDLQASDTYHHAMRNYSTSVIGSYPTAIPDGQATTGTNSASRRCTMCHVDHNVFSPVINANAALTAPRAMNLRTDIAVQPSLAAGYTNSDYTGTGTGGICISCHATERQKSTVYKKDQAASNYTPVIAFTRYSGSGHEYAVGSTITNGGATFNANCAKCHNTKSGESTSYQNSTQKFGVHKGSVARMQAPLGIPSPNEFEEEDLCYRCHSKNTDTNPGGAAAKAVANRDYFNATNMNAASQDIFTVFKMLDPVYTTTNILFLRNTAASEPAPNAEASTDTFQGGTWQSRDMTPTQGSSAQTQSVTINNTGNPRYWKMTSFVSPPVTAGTTLNAGNWTLRLWALENNIGANAWMRATIYVWTVADAKGTVILAPTSYSSELTTASAAYNWVVAGGAATLNPGDRIVVELEMDSRGATSGYTATYRWNGAAATDDSKITMPQAIQFTTGSTGGYGHPVGNYSGKHLPSKTDETRDYIATNKHVECNDCHNMHAAKQGNHTAGNSTIANVLRGASGVGVTTWGGNWAGVTAYNPATTTAALPEATAEWQVCFKCHSGANASVTTMGGSGAAAFTDLGFEFNPNNRSGHPIVTGLNNYPNSLAPKALATAQMSAPWNVNVGTQTMTCSDCHATNSASSKGPHGSSVKWMLAGTNKAWPYQGAANNGGSTGTYWTYSNRATGQGTADGLFCLNCHPVTGTNSAHSTGNHSGYKCVECHIRVPHGGKMSRLLTTYNGATLPARYYPNGNGGGMTSGNTLRAVVKRARNSYDTGDCDDGGVCHGSHDNPGLTDRW